MAKQKHNFKVNDRLLCVETCGVYINKGDKVTIKEFASEGPYKGWIVPKEGSELPLPPEVFKLYDFKANERAILVFLVQHPLISVRGLETEANIPKDTIRNALEEKRGLPEKHLEAIENILKNYGYANN